MSNNVKSEKRKIGIWNLKDRIGNGKIKKPKFGDRIGIMNDQVEMSSMLHFANNTYPNTQICYHDTYLLMSGNV